jgi:squalene synthase HpnC
MPVDHYENFPVASWLLPQRLRAPVEAIYRFARSADDIADEGDMAPAQRLAQLAEYRRALDEIDAGATPQRDLFRELAAVVRAHQLPLQPLRDLIDAFEQDVVKKRYADYAELQDYARRSANPVGRLLLHLFHRTDAESLRQSDAVCSALQYANFWQDVALDWHKGRVYIPQEDLRRFGVDEGEIAQQRAGDAWRSLMQFEVARTRALMESGAPLGATLAGRVGLEIRTTVRGGLRILDKIDAVSGDVFRHRPTLGAWDWVTMLTRSLRAP